MECSFAKVLVCTCWFAVLLQVTDQVLCLSLSIGLAASIHFRANDFRIGPDCIMIKRMKSSNLIQYL